MATTSQLRKIHVLEKVLGLQDTEYRALLSGFSTPNGQRAASSKDLSVSEASALIDTLERMIDERPALKAREYASPRQRGFIMALWRNVSRMGYERGFRQTLDSFLRRRFHVSRFDRIPRKKASKVINALKRMNGRKTEKASPDQNSGQWTEKTGLF
jgi:hypothetical protein